MRGSDHPYLNRLLPSYSEQNALLARRFSKKAYHASVTPGYIFTRYNITYDSAMELVKKYGITISTSGKKHRRIVPYSVFNSREFQNDLRKRQNNRR